VGAGAAGDAMLEGFYRGVALCEEVVRGALHAQEHGGLLAELAAICQEARDRRDAGAWDLSPAWSASVGLRSPALGSNARPRHCSGSGEEQAVLDEVVDLQVKLHEKELLLAAARDNAVSSGREAAKLREELLEQDEKLAASSAREAAGFAELRTELDKRGRQVLHLQAELARAYAAQVYRLRNGADAEPPADLGGATSKRAGEKALAPPLHAQLPESPPTGKDKGSYIHAAGGKVYWLNHDDPLDLQRLPDHAAAVASSRSRRIGEPCLGSREPGVLARLEGPTLLLQSADTLGEEPLLPGTPEPPSRVAKAESVPSPLPPSLRWSGLMAPSDSDPMPLHMQSQQPAASRVKHSRSGPGCQFVSQLVDHEMLAASTAASWSAMPVALTSVPSAPVLETPMSQVARRHLSEPRLGGGMTAPPLSARGSHVHRSWSPVPWSPIVPPPPLSARPQSMPRASPTPPPQLLPTCAAATPGHHRMELGRAGHHADGRTGGSLLVVPTGPRQ